LSEKKTILIVDDHPFFREGLKSLILRQPGFEIIGEAGRADEAFQKAKALSPDLVIMDIALPDGSGIETARSIRSHLPGTLLVMLSVHSKIDYISQAFQAGATGYVIKESAPEQLLQCLNAVLKGEYYIDPSLSPRVVEGLVRLSKRGGDIPGLASRGYKALTPREQEVMRLLAEGLSTKRIAEKLFISQKTVENHRSNIMRKLDLHTTAELIRFAAKIGLIDLSSW